MENKKWLDWDLEAAWLASQALKSHNKKATKGARAALAEQLRSLMTAHVLVHKEQPSLNDLATVLSAYLGTQTLIGQAVRSARTPAQKKSAQRCNAWRKASAKGTDLDVAFLGNCFTRWVSDQDGADEHLTPLEGEARTTAAEKLGWYLTEEDEKKPTSQAGASTRTWKRFENALASAAKKTIYGTDTRLLHRVHDAAVAAGHEDAVEGDPSRESSEIQAWKRFESALASGTDNCEDADRRILRHVRDAAQAARPELTVRTVRDATRATE